MKVSVITVCLNSEKYIEQTIKSVLNQTYKDIEYIIIDGLSTDNTINIIKKYEPLFNGRMKFISEKDNGLYDAMNKGIKMATGDIIGIINSDDWYEDYTIEEVAKLNDNKSIIYGDLLVVGGENDAIQRILMADYKGLKNNMIPHPTVFVPKSIYDKFGTFNCKYRIAADYDLMLRFYKSDVSFNRIPKILASFRNDGLSSKLIEKTEKETQEIKTLHGFDIDKKVESLSVQKPIKYLWDKLIEKLKEKQCSFVYLYGTGLHTKYLIDYIKENSSINVLGIIDREVHNLSEQKYGYKVFSIEDIGNKNAVVVISSLSYEYEIYKRIKTFDEDINVERIYGVDSVDDANKLVKDFVL